MLIKTETSKHDPREDNEEKFYENFDLIFGGTKIGKTESIKNKQRRNIRAHRNKDN